MRDHQRRSRTTRSPTSPRGRGLLSVAPVTHERDAPTGCGLVQRKFASHGFHPKRNIISPPLRLDVVHVGMRALSYRLHNAPDIDAIFDDGIADSHVLQSDLVTERNVLYARQC